MSRVLIGIPCYRDVPAETLEDYLRFAYHLGRRSTRHEYFVAIKAKTEQFRARNSIVEGALQVGCDYIFFLDDDHVLDWEKTSGPASNYDIIDRLIDHMEHDDMLGVVGAVYYHRGSECRPVLMKRGTDGGYYYLRDDEVTGQLQDVAVQGGGCMLLRCKMFDRIHQPWFAPEHQLGTDIQICTKALEAGFKVKCDTGIKIGHVMNSREIVTPANRHRIALESSRTASQASQASQGMDSAWTTNSALALYRQDAEEYLELSFEGIRDLCMRYSMADFREYQNSDDYYRKKGREQLARQVMFHHLPSSIEEMNHFHQLINMQAEAHGADFGCGSAPVTFEFVMKGHKMDFIDIDGSGAYEFLKWRAKKRGVSDRCGWKLSGPYDYVLMLDSLEHIKDWQPVLEQIVASIKPNGGLILNFFENMDYANPEHVNMDKEGVRKFLTNHGVYPVHGFLWVKHEYEVASKGAAA
jgi:hypothetical protein